MAGARFFVSGQVQGVGFRAATRTEALRLGIHGHARNLRDGRVEVLAFADEAVLGRFESWLQRGPDAARVSAVIRESFVVEDEELHSGFYTR